MARPIILDCDPGQDGALAILLALVSAEELELLGIATVAGNVPPELTRANARKVCELAGRDEAAVFVGYARPILQPLVTAEHVAASPASTASNCRRCRFNRSTRSTSSSTPWWRARPAR